MEARFLTTGPFARPAAQPQVGGVPVSLDVAAAGITPATIRQWLWPLCKTPGFGKRDPLDAEGYRRTTAFVGRVLQHHGVQPSALGGRSFLSDFEYAVKVPGFDPSCPRFTPVRTSNVVGVLRGGPGRSGAGEAILVVAHLDSLNRYQKRRAEREKPFRSMDAYEGANDNASGVAGVLEVAAALSRMAPLKRDVIFLLSSGEESGLLGSIAFARSESDGLMQSIRAAVNLDGTGFGRPEQLFVLDAPMGTRSAVHDLGLRFAGHAAREGLLVRSGAPVENPRDDAWTRSDQYTFADCGIPSVGLMGDLDGSDYHLPTDTAETVNRDTAAAAARITLRGVVDLASTDQPPEVHRRDFLELAAASDCVRPIDPSRPEVVRRIPIRGSDR